MGPERFFRIDRVCDEFEAAWREGGRPLPADYAGRVPPEEREGLLRELVRLDIEYRRRAGEACAAEDYRYIEGVDLAWLADALREVTAFDTGATTALPRPDETAVPACPPGYEVLGELGRGGMGVVYRARDTLGREVAVKVVRPGADLARFRFEAEAVASLDHPNVVHIPSFGEVGGEPYLVMPVLAGGGLAGLLKELGPGRRIAPKSAAGLVRDVALGAHHAHQHGLIHRDLKPANVLMTADGVPKVADFGLARPVDASTTSAGGTLAYMAPEQARGEKRLTTAVDVHALGALLFELLAGGPPFGNDHVSAVLRRLENEPPPPLPGAPAELEAVCRRCLEKRPEDRYPSAQAVAEDLGRFLAGQPLSGHRRDLVTDLDRALGWMAPHEGVGAWPGVFLGAASAALSVGGVQAAVLLRAPAWVGWSFLACYFAGWLVILWAFLIGQRPALTAVERGGLAINLGMVFAAMAGVPAAAWLGGGEVVAVFPQLFVVVGLGMFIAGSTFWGRLYLVGLLQLGMAALLPLVPAFLWPGLYALTQSAVQLWFGWEVWRARR